MSSGGGSTKGGRGKPKSTKSVSRSSKAGLKFPVGRIARFLKAGKYADRVGAGAPVYLFISFVLFIVFGGLEHVENECFQYFELLALRVLQILGLSFLSEKENGGS